MHTYVHVLKHIFTDYHAKHYRKSKQIVKRVTVSSVRVIIVSDGHLMTIGN